MVSILLGSTHPMFPRHWPQRRVTSVLSLNRMQQLSKDRMSSATYESGCSRRLDRCSNSGFSVRQSMSSLSACSTTARFSFPILFVKAANSCLSSISRFKVSISDVTLAKGGIELKDGMVLKDSWISEE